MRVVIDTNVFISGIFWKGNPYKVLIAWKAGRFINVTSLEIIAEIVRVLEDFEIQLPKSIIREWKELIISNSIIVGSNNKLKVARDQTDNKLIEAAIAGQAQCIITGDSDLLVLGEFDGIRLVSPSDFLKSTA